MFRMKRDEAGPDFDVVYCDQCSKTVPDDAVPEHCECEKHPELIELSEKLQTRWRLDDRSVLLGFARYPVADGDRGWRSGNFKHAKLLGVEMSRGTDYNKPRLQLCQWEASENGLSSTSIADLTPEICSELAVMFWKLAEGWPLDNLDEESSEA